MPGKQTAKSGAAGGPNSHKIAALSYSYGASTKPLIGETIGHMFDRIAATYPNNEALVYLPTGVRYTYGEFHDICRAAAKSLIAMGVRKGDRVAVWATNHPEWVIAQFSTALVGAILVTVNPAYKTHELEYGLKNSEAQTLILVPRFKSSDYAAMINQVVPELKGATPGAIKSRACPQLATVISIGAEKFPGMFTWDEFMTMGRNVSDEELDERGNECDFDDVINVQYTSGTTGMPKGASLTHHNILNNAYFVAEGMHFTDKDKLCIPVPLYHCFGMVLSTLVCVTHGATMVFPSEYFDALLVLEAVSKERCTALHGVPTMFIAELEHPDFKKFDFTSLRTGVMAGAPCPIELMKRVNDVMHMSEITIGYGETEASPLVTQTLARDTLERRTETVGPAMPHTELKVVDPATGSTVPIGEQGEICARGYQIMRGYYNNEKATKEAVDEAGWLHTGDIGLMRPDGAFKITGRIKDMIIRGGENIYPREIEEFLYTNQKIRDAQVIGVPDVKMGEEICVWIQLREGESATEEEIKEWCKGRIAHYKIPRYVKFVTEFPMTVTGKIQKYKMREISIRELGLEDAAKIKMA
ncbi:MAG: AMP-binding protein [Candidatus Krumholzibacteria bacterium]|nr:AMP-binding protein [Candidatus Krumholzibacteria bacterium]